MKNIHNIEPTLENARKIVTSFLINVKKNPEFLHTVEESTATGCERNMRVAECIVAIDRLKESL